MSTARAAVLPRAGRGAAAKTDLPVVTSDGGGDRLPAVDPTAAEDLHAPVEPTPAEVPGSEATGSLSEEIALPITLTSSEIAAPCTLGAEEIPERCFCTGGAKCETRRLCKIAKRKVTWNVCARADCEQTIASDCAEKYSDVCRFCVEFGPATDEELSSISALSPTASAVSSAGELFLVHVFYFYFSAHHHRFLLSFSACRYQPGVSTHAQRSDRRPRELRRDRWSSPRCCSARSVDLRAGGVARGAGFCNRRTRG